MKQMLIFLVGEEKDTSSEDFKVVGAPSGAGGGGGATFDDSTSATDRRGY